MRRQFVPLLAAQSAKGAYVDDFTADAVRLWTTEFQIDPGQPKSLPGPWMTQLETEDAESRYSISERPEGRIITLATPEAVEFLLRSNWGPLAAGTFTLKSQVNEYMTLALVEDHAAGSGLNLIRTRDVFFHRVRFRAARSEGKLYCFAQYDGRANRVDVLNALPGGVVLPASPMAPVDQRVYGVRDLQFIREPSGANVSILYENLEVILDQFGVAEWTMTDAWDVRKGGKTSALVQFQGMLSDETWRLLNDNRGNLKERFRMIATSTGGALSTLTIDLHNVDFEVEPIGHDERGWIIFRAVGRAHKSGSNFATISIT